MKINHSFSILSRNKKLALIPLILVGSFLFGQTSFLDLNYFWKSYLLAIELNLSFLLLYGLFIWKGKAKKRKINNSKI